MTKKSTNRSKKQRSEVAKAARRAKRKQASKQRPASPTSPQVNQEPQQNVAIPDVDFSAEYSPQQVQGISYRYWQNWSEYVSNSRVINISTSLYVSHHLPYLNDKLNLPVSLLLSLYLNPFEAERWKTLYDLDPEQHEHLAKRFQLTPTEFKEVVSLSQEFLTEYAYHRYEIKHSAKRLLHEYILYRPVYRFWHSLITIAQEEFDEEGLELSKSYFMVRDLCFGYDETNPYSLNVAVIISGDSAQSYEVYFSGAGICDAENYQFLLQHLQRLLRVLPFDSARTQLQHFIGHVGIFVGVETWQRRTPEPPCILNWLKLAWQFGDLELKVQFDVAYALASTLFNAERYAMAMDLFEFSYHTSPKLNTCRAAALRLAIYYSKNQIDREKREYWAWKANEIDQTGDAYDVLAYNALHVENDPEQALAYSKMATNSGTPEHRHIAAINIFNSAIDRFRHDEVSKNVERWVTEQETHFPRYLAFLQDELRNKLLQHIKSLEAENDQLQSVRSELEALLKEYRSSHREGVEIDLVESAIVETTRKILPKDQELRKVLTDRAIQQFPDALDSVRPLLIDGLTVYELFNGNPQLFDWSAPLVYFAKALESHLKEQLLPISTFQATRSGLGKMIRFLEDNQNDIADHYQVRETDRISQYRVILDIFRVDYRNGFIHEDTMSKDVLEHLFKFLFQEQLFQQFQNM